ncbi:MAG: glycosyltransferase family 4 protein [Limisphaerales bacterium]
MEPNPSIPTPVEKSGSAPATVTPARILIAPLADDPTESVSGVNRAFIQGLSDRYTFIPLRADRTRGNTRQARLNIFNLFYFARQLCQWSAHLVRRRPHIAHYAISAGWAMEKGLMFMRLARLCKVKTLAHLHSGGFPQHWRSLPRWRRANAARQFARLDGLVLASDWWRQEIARHLPLPPHKLFVVNNPIDAAFEKAALAMPLDRPGRVVLAMGVMGRAKGIFEVLEAAKIGATASKATFKLAGAEREPHILRDAREYAARNGLGETVEIIGPIDDLRKTALFREASILLLPSHYENFPLTVVEAAAAGLAIITTPVGAIPEFFQDWVSAVFVQAGDAAQIAGALQMLLAQPSERQRLGAAARQVFCTRLARSKIMDSLDAVYRQILAV